MDSTEATRSSWENAKEEFIVKFSEVDNNVESATAMEALAFTRKKNEPILAYLKRAEKLDNKSSGFVQQTLYNLVVQNLAQGGHESDTRLQERVEDRLYDAGNWDVKGAKSTLKLSEIRNAILGCRSSSSSESAARSSEVDERHPRMALYLAITARSEPQLSPVMIRDS